MKLRRLFSITSLLSQTTTNNKNRKLYPLQQVSKTIEAKELQNTSTKKQNALLIQNTFYKEPLRIARLESTHDSRGFTLELRAARKEGGFLQSDRLQPVLEKSHSDYEVLRGNTSGFLPLELTHPRRGNVSLFRLEHSQSFDKSH